MGWGGGGGGGENGHARSELGRGTGQLHKESDWRQSEADDAW